MACDDDSGTLGGEVMPSQDGIQISQALYSAITSSVAVDSVLATTSTSYLGKVVDPETQAITTSDFLCQFHTIAGYTLPDLNQMQRDENGLPVADSVELRIYVRSYYGDSLNSMKVGVYELDTARALNEGTSYYTNLDPSQYVNRSETAIKKEVVFAIKDLAQPDSVLNSSSSSNSLRVKLPVSYGNYLLSQYYSHPEYFASSYSFTHHVCAGFYVRTLSGSGTMAAIDVSALSVYFSYEQNGEKQTGVQRVAATEEVLQNTRVENKNLAPLLAAERYTYVKSPAGLLTEVTLPIDSICSLAHEGDSINSAKIAFPRYNSDEAVSYPLPLPTTLLMVRKGELQAFFEEGRVADGSTSFLTTFSQTGNTYTFSNIGPLVSYLRRERNEGAGLNGDETPAQREAKLAAWREANPDWNKVLLVPVTANYNSTGVLTRVRHDFGLASTRLAGGPDGLRPEISVVYSRFNY